MLRGCLLHAVLSGGSLVTDSNPSAPNCPSCGGPASPAAATCSYCQATLAWGGMAPKTPNRSVQEAAASWAKSVFGAPFGFADLIFGVQVRDEVLERLFTTVARRDVREERIPTSQRRSSPPRVDPRSVDPFAIAPDALRAASEYVTSCARCGGSGSSECGHCSGGGRAACRNCGGSGHVRKYNRKSSRLVKCGVCRGGGSAPCGTCNGGGTVTCQGCTGSGHEVAWLAYDETSHGNVTVVPDSPVLVAYPQLREGRALAANELSAFATLKSVDARGPLLREGIDAIHSPLVREQAASVDPRLERISFQQYLKLAVVRRDATYEMCGTSGVLVFSGCDLVGARTPEALRPIHRRLYVWAAVALGLIVATRLIAGALVGTTAYFARTNGEVVAASWTGAALAFVFLGAALRELRPSFKFGTLKPIEKISGLGALAAVGVAGIIAVASRPRLAEVQQALSVGDTPRAKLVVEALVATKGETPDVREAVDATLMAEAEKVSGEPKLRVLDEVASRGGGRAPQAVQAARVERIREIQQAIDEKRMVDAVANIDRWFPNWKSDPEVGSKRALADDVAYSSCPDDPCRYANATEANTALSTSERAARAAAAKATIVSRLSVSDVPSEPPLTRLQRLRSMIAVATQPAITASIDAEIAGKAKIAVEWARGERAKVALMNADEAVASELLGPLNEQDSKTATATVDGVGVFLSLDSQKKCRGVYMVGPTPGTRQLDANGEAATRLLSQAVGHPATVKPAGNAATSRWTEGATPVLARWKDGKLMELRVGDATP